MSYEEREALARDIAERLKHHNCPLGLTDLDVEGIRLLGKIAKIGGGTAIVTGVGVIVTGILGVFALGIIAWIKTKI
jgi:hypothetical protein